MQGLCSGEANRGSTLRLRRHRHYLATTEHNPAKTPALEGSPSWDSGPVMRDRGMGSSFSFFASISRDSDAVVVYQPSLGNSCSTGRKAKGERSTSLLAPTLLLGCLGFQ